METPERDAQWIDVAVAGAGAAGLMAAAAAAAAGARTLVLEKTSRPGAKILASGGARCNVTTALPGSEAARAFPSAVARFLRPAFARFGPEALRRLLADEGVPTKVEPLFDKVFPASGRAGDVLLALVGRAERAGAEFAPRRPVRAVLPAEGGFRVITPRGQVRARTVVMACGGASYPRTGCTGDGYRMLAQLGHRIVPLRPALVPLVVEAEWVRELAGVAAPAARVQAIDERGKVLRESRRPVLFTHRGLSGPGPMDVSAALTPPAQPGRAAAESTGLRPGRLRIDWIADVSDADLAAALAARGGGPSPVAARIPGGLPARLVRALMRLARVPPDRAAAQLTREERRRLVDALKRCEIPVDGHEGFDRAEVTAGGVDLDEVDRRSMESRVVAGLFLCGELLDIDGPIGGFNFQAAFSTGLVAGEHAAVR
jgi:predicted Rossmann fold flavoprotein